MEDCKCKSCGCGKLTTEQIIDQMDDQRKPFTEDIIDDHTKIRHFEPGADWHLFKWHWDEEDRWVDSLTENDWGFQFDNELPQTVEPNKIIFIPKGMIHRVIPGKTPISIRIKS
jgi:hypothetical protein